jgi:hypothetical protein
VKGEGRVIQAGANALSLEDSGAPVFSLPVRYLWLRADFAAVGYLWAFPAFIDSWVTLRGNTFKTHSLKTLRIFESSVFRVSRSRPWHPATVHGTKSKRGIRFFGPALAETDKISKNRMRWGTVSFVWFQQNPIFKVDFIFLQNGLSAELFGEHHFCGTEIPAVA